MVFPSSGEDIDDTKREDKDEQADNEGNKNNNPYGIIPLLMALASKTMTPIHNIYDWPITEALFMLSYIVDENQKEIRAMKKAYK